MFAPTMFAPIIFCRGDFPPRGFFCGEEFRRDISVPRAGDAIQLRWSPPRHKPLWLA
jgi:hypothetical protein